MGIEPTTSPTLKENHTTRPMARTVTPYSQFDNLLFQKGQRATRKKGATGIEPVTAGSAIPCSTAELCARMPLIDSILPLVATLDRIAKIQVLPGLEPGSKDSESLVITITLQDHTSKILHYYHRQV